MRSAALQTDCVFGLRRESEKPPQFSGGNIVPGNDCLLFRAVCALTGVQCKGEAFMSTSVWTPRPVWIICSLLLNHICIQ